MAWPNDRDSLTAIQRDLAAAKPNPWTFPPGPLTLGGCFVCFARGESGPGHGGDRGWAGAALVTGQRSRTAVVEGVAGAPYIAGLLALREGPLLEAATRGLPELPDVLLVNATGRDHPRRAGLATHIGAVLGLPTVGVTHRPLVAAGDWPPPVSDARTPLLLDHEVVGYWVRTREGTRPLAVHAAWRTDPDVAVQVVLAALSARRTPFPIAEARRAAREARARATEAAR